MVINYQCFVVKRSSRTMPSEHNQEQETSQPSKHITMEETTTLHSEHIPIEETTTINAFWTRSRGRYNNNAFCAQSKGRYCNINLMQFEYIQNGRNNNNATWAQSNGTNRVMFCNDYVYIMCVCFLHQRDSTLGNFVATTIPQSFRQHIA